MFSLVIFDGRSNLYISKSGKKRVSDLTSSVSHVSVRHKICLFERQIAFAKQVSRDLSFKLLTLKLSIVDTSFCIWVSQAESSSGFTSTHPFSVFLIDFRFLSRSCVLSNFPD